MADLKIRERKTYFAGGYSLHLYCKYDNPNHAFFEFPHEYDDGETFGEAAASARKDGWIIHRDRTSTCPKCRAALEGKNA